MLFLIFQWYLYGFDEGASDATKAFVGYNKGTPENTPDMDGLFAGMAYS